MKTAVAGGAGLTATYLTEALAPHLRGAAISSVEVVAVGTGQVSDSFRLHLGYDQPVPLPPTLIAKVPAADQDSRGAAKAFRTYEIEASFYAQVAPGLPVALAACYFSCYEPEPDEYVVLLEDLAPAIPGDQIQGLGADDAAAAIDELAALHAAGWESQALAALPWLNRSSPEGTALMLGAVTGLYPGFRDRYAGSVEAATVTLIEDFLPHLPQYLTSGSGPSTIVHGDFRADNLLFGGSRPVVLDWQTCSFGAPAGDLAYFVASSLQVADRQRHEEDLVRQYHAGLASGGVDLSWSECWTSYRRHAFSGLIMDVIASMLVRRTPRGDAMFCAMADRHARHAIDLDSLTLLA